MQCPVGTPADLRADLQTISENPFGEDTVYWNAMCNILPVYECQPPNGATLSASQLEACIQGLLNTNQVQGPYLCRDFCSPSPFNADNQLLQDPIWGCVCLVGVGVGSGAGAPPYVPEFATIGHHRRSLAALPSDAGPDSVGAYSNVTLAMRTVTMVEHYMSGAYGNPALPSTSSGVTACVRESHCDAPDAACRRPDGTTVPCEACPLRLSQPNFTGYACAAAQCTCVSPSPAPEYESELEAPVWQGYSRCAVVGRAYGNRTDLSALEYVALRECVTLYRAGQFLAIATGAPLDPSVAYDIRETMRVLATAVAGAVLERVYAGSSPEALEAALREAGLEPALYFGLRGTMDATLSRAALEFPRAAQLSGTASAAAAKMALAVSKAPKRDDLFSAVSMVADGVRAMAHTAAAATARERAAASEYATNATKADAAPSDDLYIKYVAAEDTGAAPSLVWASRRLRAMAPGSVEATLDALGELHRAGARELLALQDTTCWVLSEARSVANDVITNIKNQYVYNGARAVCIFLQRSDCPQRYEDYYKSTTPIPPPPPRPPPYHAPPPKPPASPPAVVPAYPHLKTLQSVILSGVGGLAGIDLDGALNTVVQKILTYSPANPAVVQQSLTEVTRVLQCDYNASPFCLKRKMPLIEGVLRLGIGVVVVNLGLKFLGLDLTLLANVFMSVFFVPVLFKIVYDVPFGCSLLPPFIFPVCLLDDVLPIFNVLFGRHISWPPALLVSGSRTTVTIPNAFGASKTATTLTKDQIVDCVAKTQLYDGARYVLWALEAYVPMWRRKVPLVTTLLSTQSDMYNLITMYQGVPHATLTSPVYKACAGTMFPVLFPTLALLILFLVFGIGIIHIILVIIKHLFRAFASFVEAMTSYFETAKNELAEEDEDEDDE